MELLIILGLGIYALVLSSRVSSVDKRLAHMERYLADATKQFASNTPTVVQSDAQVDPQAVATKVRELETELSMSATREPGVVETFFAWCATDWLMKLGGFLVLLGFGWFVSYAFANNWIGPVGRITLGLITGMSVLTLGRYRLNTFVTQGSVLMVVGASGVVLTVYAARELYDLFSPASALVIMFLTATLLGVTAVVTKHKPLAYGNALIVAVAPLLVASTAPSVVGLFAYLLAGAAGALAVAARTGWTELVFVSLVSVWLYSTTWLGGDGNAAELDQGLLFAYFFTVLYFATSIVAMMRVRTARLVDLGIAVASGAFLLSWILGAASPEWHALLCSMWTLVFAGGAYLAVSRGAPAEFFFAYGGVGVVYLGLATAMLLEGPVLTIAYILEALALVIGGYTVTHRAQLVPALSLTLIVPVVLSVESMGARAWETGVLHAHAAVLLLIILGFAYVAAYFGTVRERLSVQEREPLYGVVQAAWVLVGLYSMVFIWLAMHAITIDDDTGTLMTLVIYTLIASYLFVAAKMSGIPWQRMTAIGLFAFVVGRLVLIDVWSMALAGRVVTFLLIGALLIAVAWFERSAVRSQQHPVEH